MDQPAYLGDPTHGRSRPHGGGREHLDESAREWADTVAWAQATLGCIVAPYAARWVEVARRFDDVRVSAVIRQAEEVIGVS